MEYVDYFDGEIRIRKSIRSDVFKLKDILRSEDVNELCHMGIVNIENTLLHGFEAPESLCYTVEFQNKVVAMFGRVPIPETDAAAIWMLSSEEVKRFPKRFLSLATSYVKAFKSDGVKLVNFIHHSNKMSMKLLCKLKADFQHGFQSEKTKEPIILFVI